MGPPAQPGLSHCVSVCLLETVVTPPARCALCPLPPLNIPSTFPLQLSNCCFDSGPLSLPPSPGTKIAKWSWPFQENSPLRTSNVFLSIIYPVMVYVFLMLLFSLLTATRLVDFALSLKIAFTRRESLHCRLGLGHDSSEISSLGCLNVLI